MEFNTLSLILCIALVVVGAVCFFIGMTYRKKVAEKEIGSAEEEARRIINESIKGGESKKREMLLEAKEEIHKSRTEYEREVRERRADLQTRPDSGVPVFASVGFDRLCSIQIDPPFRNMIQFGAENVYQTCLTLQLIPLDMLIKDAYICHFSAFLR